MEKTITIDFSILCRANSFLSYEDRNYQIHVLYGILLNLPNETTELKNRFGYFYFLSEKTTNQIKPLWTDFIWLMDYMGEFEILDNFQKLILFYDLTQKTKSIYDYLKTQNLQHTQTLNSLYERLEKNHTIDSNALVVFRLLNNIQYIYDSKYQKQVLQCQDEAERTNLFLFSIYKSIIDLKTIDYDFYEKHIYIKNIEDYDSLIEQFANIQKFKELKLNTFSQKIFSQPINLKPNRLAKI